MCSSVKFCLVCSRYHVHVTMFPSLCSFCTGIDYQLTLTCGWCFLFSIYIPNVLETVLHDDVVCTPDAMDMLLSLFRLLNVSTWIVKIVKKKCHYTKANT